MNVFLNRVATTVPPNDVHSAFVDFAESLLEGNRSAPLFNRLVKRSQIEHRWSVLQLADNGRSALAGNAEVYRRGSFPTTAQRMRLFERYAADLGEAAVRKLDLGEDLGRVTHVLAVSCTGLYAPGLDLELVARCGLDPSVERTVVGFMGCYAAINALKLARHIVRSEPGARVLIVSVELCTLHFQETSDLEKVLSFLIFGDGCAAALVSADPEGLSLDRFHAALLPSASEQITWHIGDQGFDMHLSGQVPASVGEALRLGKSRILDGTPTDEIDLWAVHPGGRTILDAVEGALELGADQLSDSREVLRNFGNMSSATVLFVLERLMARAQPGERGCAMAFGPGLTAETLLFHAA
jgi:predicted naringenin-chalcone synthase